MTFPIWDADGDLVAGAAGLDSEVSKDGGTFADCTNEATQIATSSGVYYLDLTATEMDADTVAIIVKTSTSGAKTTAIVLYPEESGDYRADVTKVSGSDVSTTTAQLGVNVVQAAGTNWNSGAVTAAAMSSGAVTEIVDAVRAIAAVAPTSTPAANATLEAVLGFLLAEVRNRKTMNRSTGVVTLYQDDGATAIGSYTVTDNGTTLDKPEMT